jgi:hypothetical protein
MSPANVAVTISPAGCATAAVTESIVIARRSAAFSLGWPLLPGRRLVLLAVAAPAPTSSAMTASIIAAR